MWMIPMMYELFKNHINNGASPDFQKVEAFFFFFFPPSLWPFWSLYGTPCVHTVTVQISVLALVYPGVCWKRFNNSLLWGKKNAWTHWRITLCFLSGNFNCIIFLLKALHWLPLIFQINLSISLLIKISKLMAHKFPFSA